MRSRRCELRLGAPSQNHWELALQELKLNSKFSSGRRYLRYWGRFRGVVMEHRYLSELWYDLLQDFQAFPTHFRRERADSCNVPVRPREARDEPSDNRVGNGHEDDGYRARGFLGRLRGGGCRRDDQIYLETGQVGSELTELINIAPRKPALDDRFRPWMYPTSRKPSKNAAFGCSRSVPEAVDKKPIR